MAGFVALDVVLLGCLLTPITGLKAAPHAYRLTERPIYLTAQVGTSEVNKPSPVGDPSRSAVSAPLVKPVVTTVAFVEVDK